MDDDNRDRDRDRIEPVQDYFSGNAPEAHAVDSALERPPAATVRPRALSNRSRRPSIRLSRLPSLSSLDTDLPQLQSQPDIQPGPSGSRPIEVRSPVLEEDESPHTGRRRSSSEPRPGRWSSPPTDVLSRVATPMRMMPLAEESRNNSMTPLPGSSEAQDTVPENGLEPSESRPPVTQPGRLRRTSQAALNRFSRNRASTVTGAPTLNNTGNNQDAKTNEYGSHVVDVLDVIDPEVSALSTLTNVQNSLFVPNLGGFINRMPTYTITRPLTDEEQTSSTDEGESDGDKLKERPTLDQLRPFTSMSSVLVGPRYAVLPEGHALEGWTREDFMELNDHVRHMLHSRRSKFKRAMKGFGQYVRKPLGFFITLYATLITLFGLAWVLFLIGWINVGGKQIQVVNIIDNILVGLFAIMGDGLAPFRAVDTYHMIFIAHYTHLTWKIRGKRQLPNLKDKNDLPSQREKDVDEDEHEYSVLDARQQLRLMHHQNKFAKSHTFYKPHETFTHHAFPLRILVAIVVLLDCHSLLQMALGACTWSMEDPGQRPFALTTVILCCSITCNISGGVLIMIGDRRTRKKEIVERLFRQQLTEEAMQKMERRKAKEERKSLQINRPAAYEGT
ncbi:hypothetical protein N7509_011817 [Penicillium cosmopolitanum]|uniref:Integral membrane protein n=1 Tax=Penicillium cosmopolitanum TaxID=1131564 RepID=A0A9W9VE13_9EURO|nr:uncharacterized protein N7509_011817 [Penicillium cosmopolitanum]KAJ5378698.1 hypothetical protein N7509_011817 [Penicillium cosmopolitanum]